jgi:hypothetical protein
MGAAPLKTQIKKHKYNTGRMTYYTQSYAPNIAEPADDLTRYTFYLATFGDMFFNLRLELHRDDARGVVTAASDDLLDSYDMNKWPAVVKHYDDKSVYSLDFWFSRKDTPLYSQSVAYGLRRVEVLMLAARHIRLIRTDKLVPYDYLKQLFQQGIKQLGYRHRETVYRGHYIMVNLKKLNGKKIMFHVAARVGRIDVVVLSKSADINHKITGDDLRRDCIVEKNIYELYFGDADKALLAFAFDQEAELTMLDIEPMDIVQGDNCTLTMQELCHQELGFCHQKLEACDPARAVICEPLPADFVASGHKRRLCWPSRYPELDD